LGGKNPLFLFLRDLSLSDSHNNNNNKQDHFQLPPTVTSARAEAEGMGKSLFQRLVEEGVPHFLLQTQYRFINLHSPLSLLDVDFCCF
jgi:hypothetical protein